MRWIKSQITSTNLFTLLNNSDNGEKLFIIRTTLTTYAKNPCKMI